MARIFPMSDTYLVRQTLRGQREAFGVLVERHLDAVHGLAFAMLRNHADAEDVTQDAFLKAYESLPTLREPRRFSAWLATIARNLCHQRFRTQKRETGLSAEDEDQLAVTPDMGREEVHALLRSRINRLDDMSREVLVLYYFAGRNSREIAGMLDITTSAAKKRLERARQALSRGLLKDIGDALESPRSREERKKDVLGAVLASASSWLGKGAAPVAGGVTLGWVLNAVLPAGFVVSIGLLGLLAHSVYAGKPGGSAGDVSKARIVEAGPTADDGRRLVQMETTATGSKSSKAGAHSVSTNRSLRIDNDGLKSKETKELSKPWTFRFLSLPIAVILEHMGPPRGTNYVLMSPKKKGMGINKQLRRYKTDGLVPYVDVHGVPLRDALANILRPLGLAYRVLPGYIWISTPDRIHSEFKENSKDDHGGSPEQKALDEPINLLFASEHIAAIIDAVHEKSGVNFSLDYRVIAPPDIVNTPDAKARAHGWGSDMIVLYAVNDSPQGATARIRLNGEAPKSYGEGDEFGMYQVKHIDRSHSEVTVWDRKDEKKLSLQTSGEAPRLDTTSRSLQCKISPDIVSNIHMAKVSLGAALEAMLRPVDCVSVVKAGYLLIGPKAAVGESMNGSGIDDMRMPDAMAKMLEQPVRLVVGQHASLSTLQRLLDENLDKSLHPANLEFGSENEQLGFRVMPEVLIKEPIPLAVVLDAILHPTGLKWSVQGEAIQISD